ncbi:MAG TPA: TonB-dependent receptor plug domain-containing protein, partial [Saprospiraceae bacterium]|nr:TonB-dependent receptor plug domain-containing protein [Saprospiraceae bacterium]
MKNFLLLLMSIWTLNLGAQSLLRGKLIDVNNDPLIGATVIVKGTNTGTTTDLNGVFEIALSGQQNEITVSFIGYKSKDVLVNGQSFLEVILEEDRTTLDEVVISALGFVGKKDRSGSTASSVSSTAIKSSGEANLLNSLAGKASGVKIVRANGDPGAGTNIQIRGANTIGGSSQPLIIVDGIPLSNDNLYGSSGREGRGVSQQSRINDINPEDVESVQILKGASAAALWGSRAANGVLMITTKSGKLNQKMKVSVSSTYSIDEINRRHPLQSTFGQGAAGVFSPTAVNSWGDKIATRTGEADAVNTTGQYFIGSDGTRIYPITKKNSTEIFNDKNFDAVFQKGFTTDNNITFTGGGAKTNNYFSLGYLNQEGIVKQSTYSRATVRFNNQTFMTDKVVLTTKANYVYTNSNRIQQNSNTAGLLLGLLRTPPDFDN